MPQDTNLTIKEIRVSLLDTIRLLENALAEMSQLRQKMLLKYVNTGILDLALEDIFDDAATNLFGNDFERKMKDRAESVRLLTATSGSRPQQPPEKHYYTARR